MAFQAFHEVFREVAEAETRTILLPEGQDLAAGAYMLLELYCNDKGCDCRRVMFYVHDGSEKGPVAVVGWGWEDMAFYKNWGAGWVTEKDAAMMKGPSLDLSSPQGPLAEQILQIMKDFVLCDPDYVDRIKEHYKMFRRRIDRASSRRTGIRSTKGKKRKR